MHKDGKLINGFYGIISLFLEIQLLNRSRVQRFRVKSIIQYSINLEPLAQTWLTGLPG